MYIYICLVRAYSVYIHPAPFVRNTIFPHCMLTTVAQETRLVRQAEQWEPTLQGLENGEERKARLARWRLIINVLRDTTANGECSVY